MKVGERELEMAGMVRQMGQVNPINQTPVSRKIKPMMNVGHKNVRQFPHFGGCNYLKVRLLSLKTIEVMNRQNTKFPTVVKRLFYLPPPGERRFTIVPLAQAT